jgi:bifunctional non-homologous end joining protein LigD
VHHGGGRDLLEAAAERGLEGLVAKREEAPYQPGKRSSTWRKVKIRRRQELVVGGWTEGEGTRATRLGSLLVGHYENQPEGEASEEPRLRFAGRVGTGFTERELARLGGLLAELATDRCPFVPPPGPAEAGPAHWCRPELVVEVAFAEWTADGRLRHPSYLGQRMDKPPTGVVREPG